MLILSISQQDKKKVLVVKIKNIAIDFIENKTLSSNHQQDNNIVQN